MVLMTAALGCKRVQMPNINTAGIDPVVAMQISNTVAEVKHNQSSGAAWGKLGIVLKANTIRAPAQHGASSASC
jgi:hypothetical protein